MDTIGTGAGTINMGVNGAVTPVLFHIRPAAGTVLFIHRHITSVVDNGVPDSGGFGSGPALTNGIEYGLYDFNTSVFTSLVTQKPIKTNVDLVAYSFDNTIQTYGSGNTALVVEYSLLKDGAPRMIMDHQGYSVRVRDDMSGLIQMNVRVGCTVAKRA